MSYWNYDPPLSPLLRRTHRDGGGYRVPHGRRCPIDGTPMSVGWGSCPSVQCSEGRDARTYYHPHRPGCPLAGAPRRREDAAYCSTRCRVTADRRRRAVTARSGRMAPAVAIARAVTAASGHAHA